MLPTACWVHSRCRDASSSPTCTSAPLPTRDPATGRYPRARPTPASGDEEDAMTSFGRWIGAEAQRWPNAVWVASAFWLAAGGIASTVSIRAADGSGQAVLLGAA